jgi:hypothetical protein
MKLLYIGHYKENSGWSRAAVGLIKAIQTTDIDVVCRDIKLTEVQPELTKDILELEKKNLQDIDYCIQHILPHHMVGTQKFKKNIGYFVSETDSIGLHNWSNSLSLLDEIWVPNQDSKNNLINDGFDEKSIRVIPHAFDLTKYIDTKNRLSFHGKNHTFKFYFVCEIDDRKNIESIIRCFHSEFNSNEPVLLVLKIKKNGVDQDLLRSEMGKICDRVKNELRLHKNLDGYNTEILITEDFTDEQMNILHLSCDCYVGPTHGEGWSIPAFDAMCFGNTPICSNEGGPKEFIDPNNKNTGWLIDGIKGICNHRNPAFQDLFTGHDNWFIPNELEIKKAMRFYYENRKSKNKDGLKRGEQFSYQKVGQLIKEELNG